MSAHTDQSGNEWLTISGAVERFGVNRSTIVNTIVQWVSGGVGTLLARKIRIGIQVSTLLRVKDLERIFAASDQPGRPRRNAPPKEPTGKMLRPREVLARYPAMTYERLVRWWREGKVRRKDHLSRPPYHRYSDFDIKRQLDQHNRPVQVAPIVPTASDEEATRFVPSPTIAKMLSVGVKTVRDWAKHCPILGRGFNTIEDPADGRARLYDKNDAEEIKRRNPAGITKPQRAGEVLKFDPVAPDCLRFEERGVAWIAIPEPRSRAYKWIKRGLVRHGIAKVVGPPGRRAFVHEADYLAMLARKRDALINDKPRSVEMLNQISDDNVMISTEEAVSLGATLSMLRKHSDSTDPRRRTALGKSHPILGRKFIRGTRPTPSLQQENTWRLGDIREWRDKEARCSKAQK